MTTIDRSALDDIKTDQGNSLLELSRQKPVLLIFLRHFGCIFCREAMKDIAGQLSEINDRGVHPVFVHMADAETANEYFVQYGLSGIEHISDPECNYYDIFGLLKGTFNQLYGLQVWIRGIQTSVKEGNSFSLKQIGDGLQMPGIFYIVNGQVREEYIHMHVSDRPNYQNIMDCCVV